MSIIRKWCDHSNSTCLISEGYNYICLIISTQILNKKKKKQVIIIIDIECIILERVVFEI